MNIQGRMFLLPFTVISRCVVSLPDSDILYQVFTIIIQTTHATFKNIF